MRRPLAHRAEVARRGDDPPAEVLGPDPVDDHAGGQRVVLRRDRPRQLEPAAPLCERPGFLRTRRPRGTAAGPRRRGWPGCRGGGRSGCSGSGLRPATWITAYLAGDVLLELLQLGPLCLERGLRRIVEEPFDLLGPPDREDTCLARDLLEGPRVGVAELGAVARVAEVGVAERGEGVPEGERRPEVRLAAPGRPRGPRPPPPGPWRHPASGRPRRGTSATSPGGDGPRWPSCRRDSPSSGRAIPSGDPRPWRARPSSARGRPCGDWPASRRPTRTAPSLPGQPARGSSGPRPRGTR